MAHTRERAVGFEAEHAGAGGGLFGDDDRLTHDPTKRSAWVRSFLMGESTEGGVPAPPVPADRTTPPVPWRTIFGAIGAAALVYVGFHLLLDLQRIVTWIVVAGFFAIVLNPLVDFLVHRANLRRTLAAFVVFLLGIAVLGGLLYLLIRPIVTEVQRFANDFPRLVQDAQDGRGPVGHLVKRYDLVAKAKQYEPKVRSALQSSGGQAITIVQKVGNGAVATLTILVLTFLMLLEGPRTLAGGVGLLRADRQVRLRRVGHDSARAITGYMAGNVLISLIASLVTYVGLWIFGVPFRGVAALWVGFADLIPLVGATLGAVPTIALALTHSTTAGIGMLIIYVVYQQFENHVIQVAIMSRTVRLSPLAVLVALLAGVQLFGLLGALLAIPVAGIIQVVSKDIYQERQRRRAGQELAARPPDPAPAVVGPSTVPSPNPSQD
ncbi:MAG: AI-2E family transporter [Acidimicrobiales bacterium]